MARSFAISLGSLAMGLVVLRGVLHGEIASNVATEAIGTLFVFLGIGAMAGWIVDQLVRDAVEDLYRKRVQWFRDGVTEMAPGETTNDETATKV